MARSQRKSTSRRQSPTVGTFARVTEEALRIAEPSSAAELSESRRRVEKSKKLEQRYLQKDGQRLVREHNEALSASTAGQCQCSIQLEDIYQACRRYVHDKVSVRMPPSLWQQSGSSLVLGELFAGVLWVWNRGGVPLEDCVLMVSAYGAARLYVPDDPVCRTGWQRSDPLIAPGTKVRSYAAFVGGMPEFQETQPFASYVSLHFTGRAGYSDVEQTEMRLEVAAWPTFKYLAGVENHMTVGTLGRYPVVD